MAMTPLDRFNSALAVILKHEGHYSNDPHDPRGPTDYGISLRFLKDYDIDINADDEINIKDIQALDLDKATEIYKQYWWDKYHYEAINSLYIATKVFDMAVNMGGSQAHKLVQRACNSCDHHLQVDGILGGLSLGAINEICLHGRESDLKSELREQQKGFYEHLVERKPNLNVFLKGWLRRASW